MNVLVLNAGSSSLKFQLINTNEEKIANDADVRLARGLIERIGGHAVLTLEVTGEPMYRETAPIRDLRAALDTARESLGLFEADLAKLLSEASRAAEQVHLGIGGSTISRS